MHTAIRGVAVVLALVAHVACTAPTLEVVAVNTTSTPYVLRISGSGADREFALPPGASGIARFEVHSGARLRAWQLTEECRAVTLTEEPFISLPAANRIGLRLTDRGLEIDDQLEEAPSQLSPTVTCAGDAPPTGPPSATLGAAPGSGRSDSPHPHGPTPTAVTPTPRPIAAGTWRKIRAAPVDDGIDPTGVWTGVEFVVWGRAGLSDGAAYDPATDTWRALPEGPRGSRRQLGAVWTGEVVIAWDGRGGTGNIPDGGIYDPVSDKWHPIAPGPLKSGKGQAVAWTDSEMLVLTPDMRAAAYDPETDAWRDLPTPPLPEGPVIAEWTGAEWLVVAMGAEPREPAPAASYDPDSGTWRPLAPSLLTGLDEGLDGLWTGDRLIVLRSFQGGVAYDPASDRWEPIEGGDCGIETVSAVWTGEVALTQRFWFDPSTGECHGLPPAPAREGLDSNRYEFGAVAWTGAEFLVWGGAPGDIDVAPPDGAAFSLR